MQTQSDPTYHAEFEDLAQDHPTHQNSEPSAVEKRFLAGAIHGLLFSTIFWLLLAEAFIRFTR